MTFPIFIFMPSQFSFPNKSYYFYCQKYSAMRQFTFLWLLLMAYLPVAAQTADGTITLTTQHDVSVAQAQIIVSVSGEPVDTLLTNSDGVATFSGWQLTGITNMPEDMPVRISPNPGASQYVVVPQVESNAVAQVYNLQGKIVAYPTFVSQQGGNAVFYWAADPQVADGIYIFRYGPFTSRILRINKGTAAYGRPARTVLKSGEVFSFSCIPTQATAIVFQPVVFEATLQESNNALSFDIDAESYIYTIVGETQTDSVTYTLSRNSEVFVQSGLAVQQTGNDHADTITRLATQMLDSLEILVEKDSMHPWDTIIGMQAGLNEIDFPSLQIVQDYDSVETILGTIRRQRYNETGTTGISNALVIFEGINTNYTDRDTMNNEDYYEFTNLHLAVDAQGNAIPTQYKRTILPTDTTSTGMFKDYVDTVTITKDDYYIGQTVVQQLDQNVTLKGTIRDLYNFNTTLDSVNVILETQPLKKLLLKTLLKAMVNSNFQTSNVVPKVNGLLATMTTMQADIHQELVEHTLLKMKLFIQTTVLKPSLTV
jgi:hypothetical protein